MSANDYWAKAQSGSPGTNLAEMQARLYAGETTQRMMEKFDHKLQTFTMGISDPTELDAAQQRAQALLTEKMAIANRFSSQSGRKGALNCRLAAARQERHRAHRRC